MRLTACAKSKIKKHIIKITLHSLIESSVMDMK